MLSGRAWASGLMDIPHLYLSNCFLLVSLNILRSPPTPAPMLSINWALALKALVRFKLNISARPHYITTGEKQCCVFLLLVRQSLIIWLRWGPLFKMVHDSFVAGKLPVELPVARVFWHHGISGFSQTFYLMAFSSIYDQGQNKWKCLFFFPNSAILSTYSSWYYSSVQKRFFSPLIFLSLSFLSL